MGAFICIFCPAVVTFLLYEKISKKKSDLKYEICFYLLSVMAVNCLASILCWAFLNFSASFEVFNSSPIIAIKYIAVSLVISAIVGVIAGWIRKNVSVSIVVKKDKKKKKNGKAKKSS